MNHYASEDPRLDRPGGAAIRPRSPLSNRAPTRTEQDEGLKFFRLFRAIFPGAQLAAAGRIAERMLSAGGFEHRAVRHPSHGGKVDFQKGILAIEENFESTDE